MVEPGGLAFHADGAGRRWCVALEALPVSPQPDDLGLVEILETL